MVDLGWGYSSVLKALGLNLSLGREGRKEKVKKKRLIF